jgi:hypothetical protein
VALCALTDGNRPVATSTSSVVINYPEALPADKKADRLPLYQPAHHRARWLTPLKLHPSL